MEILLTETARLRSDARQWHLESRKRTKDGKLTGWAKRGSYPRITDVAASAIVDLLMRDGDGVTTWQAFLESLKELAFPIGASMRPDLVVQRFVQLCNTTTHEEPAAPVENVIEESVPAVDVKPLPTDFGAGVPLNLPARIVTAQRGDEHIFVYHTNPETETAAAIFYGRFGSIEEFLDEHPGFAVDKHKDKRTGAVVWDVVGAPAPGEKEHDDPFADCL